MEQCGVPVKEEAEHNLVSDIKENIPTLLESTQIGAAYY